jgi:hypothetical protein
MTCAELKIAAGRSGINKFNNQDQSMPTVMTGVENIADGARANW